MKTSIFLRIALLLSACENPNREYTDCECVNEPMRSGEKGEACPELAQTLPNYIV